MFPGCYMAPAISPFQVWSTLEGNKGCHFFVLPFWPWYLVLRLCVCGRSITTSLPVMTPLPIGCLQWWRFGNLLGLLVALAHGAHLSIEVVLGKPRTLCALNAPHGVSVGVSFLSINLSQLRDMRHVSLRLLGNLCNRHIFCSEIIFLLSGLYCEMDLASLTLVISCDFFDPWFT